MIHLQNVTEQLIRKNKHAIEMFDMYGKEKKVADFQTIVKPFADDVKVLSDEWIVVATDYVKEKKPKYLQIKLLEDTHENLQIQSVACFQHDTKKKRFYERKIGRAHV